MAWAECHVQSPLGRSHPPGRCRLGDHRTEHPIPGGPGPPAAGTTAAVHASASGSGPPVKASDAARHPHLRVRVAASAAHLKAQIPGHADKGRGLFLAEAGPFPVFPYPPAEIRAALRSPVCHVCHRIPTVGYESALPHIPSRPPRSPAAMGLWSLPQVMTTGHTDAGAVLRPPARRQAGLPLPAGGTE